MKSIAGIVVAGALLTANAAAPSENFLAGVNGKAPNRVVITAHRNSVKPVAGSTSERSYIEVQYLETPLTDQAKKTYVLGISVIVDCDKRTRRTDIIASIDDQMNLVSRGKAPPNQAFVPPPRSFGMMLINAVCSGDWSKLEQLPDYNVAQVRARFFTP